MQDHTNAYDLTNPEGLFCCIEILTKAQVALSEANNAMASEIANVTNSLIVYSENSAENSTQPDKKERPHTAEGQLKTDTSRQAYKEKDNKGSEPDSVRSYHHNTDEIIVDVLSGKVLYAGVK